MPPISLHDINTKLGILDTRFDGHEENQEEKWKACSERQERVDAHLRFTDSRVEELRTFMIQTKTLMVVVGIIWPLVVKYLLPK